MKERHSDQEPPVWGGADHSFVDRDLKDRALTIIRAVQSPDTELPTLPEVAVEVCNLTHSETSSASDLERLIITDQALTTKVLAVANSAYYGRRETVDTIRQAVVLIGFSAVQDLVLGVSVMGLFDPALQVPGMTMKGLWAHSVGVAAAAAALAKIAPWAVGSDRAFIAGLLHDIGKPLLLTLFPEYFAEAAAYAHQNRVPFIEAERKTIMVTHDVLGDTFARASFFPPRLLAGIGGHHDPDLKAKPPGMDLLVHVSDYLVVQADQAGGDELAPPPLLPGAMDRLGLSVDRAAEAVEASLADTDSIVDTLL